MCTENESHNQQHYVNGYSVAHLAKKIGKQQASKNENMQILKVFLLILSSAANIVVQTSQNECLMADLNNPEVQKTL